MRYGILVTLAFWSATGLAHAQTGYPAPGYPYGYPMPSGYPMGQGYAPGYQQRWSGYPPTGYAYPQPYYYPARQQAMSPQPYDPFPAPGPMPASSYGPASMPDDPHLPVPPPATPLPVSPREPCEPTLVNKLGGPCCPAAEQCATSVRATCDNPPPWVQWLCRPPQEPGGYCVYGRFEVLYWWFKNQEVGGLTNTGNISGSTISAGGVSVNLTNVAPEYNDLRDADHLGLRYTGGVWLDPENTWAIEGTIFGVVSAPSPYYATGGPKVANNLPANVISSLSTLLGLTTAQTTAFLNGLSTTNVVATVGVFGGAEANLRHEIYRCEYGHIDWLLGARIVELYEYGGVADALGGVLVGTQNQFIGGQVGLEGELSLGRFFVDGVGKVALGSNHEFVSVGTASSTSTSLSNVVGNQGSHARDVFTTLGEVGVTAGFRLTCNTRLFANYTLIYLSDAVRPLPQAAPYLGGATPNFTFNSSAFWAQGASIGLEFRF